MSRELGQWFVREILPHESALTRYLRRVWQSPTELSDLRQETYVRVYQSAARALPRSPKAFLFATAHNLIVDRIRRERAVSIDYTRDLDPRDARVDHLTPERCLTARDELRRLTDAFQLLPRTTRAVIWLRRVEGLSQREAARRLGIEEGALEGRMNRGLRNLARNMAANANQLEA
jgi:RNA polymerase sigma factor (sigma-70 family)